MAKETSFSLCSFRERERICSEYTVPVEPEKVESNSISAHILRMTSNVEQLKELNYPLDKQLAEEVILNSLIHMMNKRWQEL